MNENKYNIIVDLKRVLNSVEHMIYVSCKFTRTCEMLYSAIGALAQAYEKFFELGFEYFLTEAELEKYQDIPFLEKMRILSQYFKHNGIHIDLGDYKLLKQLLLNEYESVGEYRKNLAIVFYLDDGEMQINLLKLTEFYKNLKEVFEVFNPQKIF